MLPKSWRLAGTVLCSAAVYAFAARETQAQVTTGPGVSIGQLSVPTINFGPVIDPLQAIVPGALTARALEVQQAMAKAKFDCLVAIDFLSLNRNLILSGNDPQFDSIFGDHKLATFNHVINTFNHIESALSHQTFNIDIVQNNAAGLALINTASTVNHANIGGFDYGLRHWGYSNSDSLQVFNSQYQQTVTASNAVGNIVAVTTNNVNTSFAPHPTNVIGLPWWMDTAKATVLTAAQIQNSTPAYQFAALQSNAFVTERLDAFTTNNNSIWLGNAFFTGVARTGGEISNTLDGVNTPYEKTVNDINSSIAWNSGNVVNFTPVNTAITTFSGLSFTPTGGPATVQIIDNGQAMSVTTGTLTKLTNVDPTTGGLTLTIIDPTTGQKIVEDGLHDPFTGKSFGQDNLIYVDAKGNPILSYDKTTQNIAPVYPTGQSGLGFKVLPQNQEETLISTLSEFNKSPFIAATGQIQPGGGFFGISDIASVLGGFTPGNIPSLASLDASSYGKFVHLLDAAGVTDLHAFLPIGKNATSFQSVPVFQPALP